MKSLCCRRYCNVMRHSLSPILAAAMLVAALGRGLARIGSSRAGRSANSRDQRFPRLPSTAAGRDQDRRPRRQDQENHRCRPAAPNTWRRWSSNCARAHKNTIFVAAGDLIGASPFLSAMFHDEPTIESLSMMGLGGCLGRQSRIRRGQGRTAADAERRLSSHRQMPGTAPVPRRQISLSCGQHDREEHRQDRVPALRDQGIRRHSRRLYRPDIEGHAEPRLAC